MKSIFGIAGVVILSVTPISGKAALKLEVTPTQAFAPATVRISARIDPNEDNRLLAIAADAEEFYRSSEIQLNGAEAPKTIELRFPSLPAGDYEIAAALIDSSGHPRAIVRQTARILPTLTSLTTPPSSLLAVMNLPRFAGDLDGAECSSKPSAHHFRRFGGTQALCTV
jgi:hypothetical protein